MSSACSILIHCIFGRHGSSFTARRSAKQPHRAKAQEDSHNDKARRIKRRVYVASSGAVSKPTAMDGHGFKKHLGFRRESRVDYIHHNHPKSFNG